MHNQNFNCKPSSTYGTLTYFQVYVYIPANDTARQKTSIAVLKALAWFFLNYSSECIRKTTITFTGFMVVK